MQKFPIKGAFLPVRGCQIFSRDSLQEVDVLHGDESLDRTGASPILLIHGLGASTFSFRKNLMELAEHRRVVAVDLKGFGFSKQCTNPDMSFQAEADTVIGLMDALKIERAVVVGHSLGGSIAALVAAEHPGRVDRLVLIDSATLYITRPFLTRFLHGRLLSGLAYQLAGPSRSRVRKLLRKSYADKSKVTDEDVEGYYFPFTVKNSAEMLRRFLITNNPNRNALFAKIQAPTLILWGGEDEFIDPSVREFLHRQIKNSLVMVVPGAGHALPEERPGEVDREILRFIEKPINAETQRAQR